MTVRKLGLIMAVHNNGLLGLLALLGDFGLDLQLKHCL